VEGGKQGERIERHPHIVCMCVMSDVVYVDLRQRFGCVPVCFIFLSFCIASAVECAAVVAVLLALLGP
jgi:hypothetical protein